EVSTEMAREIPVGPRGDMEDEVGLVFGVVASRVRGIPAVARWIVQVVTGAPLEPEPDGGLHVYLHGRAAHGVDASTGPQEQSLLRVGLRFTLQAEAAPHVGFDGIEHRKTECGIERPRTDVTAELLLIVDVLGGVRLDAERRIRIAEDHAIAPDGAHADAELSAVSKVSVFGRPGVLGVRLPFAGFRLVLSPCRTTAKTGGDKPQ